VDGTGDAAEEKPPSIAAVESGVQGICVRMRFEGDVVVSVGLMRLNADAPPAACMTFWTHL